MSKKSESIEIRITPDLKSQLGNLADQRGTPMSAVIRDLIAQETSPAQRPGIWRTYMLSGAVLLGLGILTSIGQGQPAAAQVTARMTFAEMDIDGDNVITAQEFDRAGGLFVTTNFGGAGVYLDDAQMTPACLAYLSETPSEDIKDRAGAFARLDTDADGVIAFGEMQNEISKTFFDEFNGLDQDGDGKLTLSEYSGADVAIDDAFSVACNVPDGSHAMAPQDAKVFFAALDEDRDAFLSLTEYIQQ